MAVYSNVAAVGSGQAALGMSNPTYALVKLAALGPGVSQPILADPDMVLRAGWIAFGVSLDPFGDGIQIYWDEPIWINFSLEHWPSIPTRLSGSFSQLSADHIRWHFSVGTTAKLYVFGS